MPTLQTNQMQVNTLTYVQTNKQRIDSYKIPLHFVVINISLSIHSVQRLFSIELKLRRVMIWD
jgi:hypothetical protein